MNKKNRCCNIILIIGLLLLKCNLFYAVNDSTDLDFYLKKYNLKNINPLIIILINPNQCQKYMIGLDALNKIIDNKQINSNVVYLLAFVREREVNYFLKNEFNISPKGNRFIQDNEFFKTLSPVYTSGVMLLLHGEAPRWYYIADAVHHLEFDTYEISYNLSSSPDSMLIDETGVPISRVAQIKILSDSTMLALDPRYNNLAIYNTKTGKIIRSLKIEYDYLELYKRYFSHGDTSKDSLVNEKRKCISQIDWKEFSLAKLNINSNKIYVSCGIMYADNVSYEYDIEDTTIVVDTTIWLNTYFFILITDFDFSLQNYVYVPEEKLKEYYLDRNKQFCVVNDSIFIFTIGKYEHNKTSELNYLARYKYSKKENTFELDKLLDITIPDYFVKNKINYGFGPNELFLYDNNVYSYFNFLLPFIYNVNDSEEIVYPDTSYKYADWYDDPLPFYMFDIASTLTDDLAFVTFEKNKYYLSIIDKKKNDNIKYRKQIPSYYAKAGKFTNKFILSNRNLYILKIGHQDSYLYTFQYLNID